MKWFAMSEIGLFHEKGIVVPQDDRKAFSYYNRAGDCGGRIKAGLFLLHGRGTEKNPEQALKKFNDSVAFGKSPLGAYLAGSLHLSGTGTEKDERKAAELLKIAAEAGYIPAMRKLSELFRHGIAGGAPDPEQASEWSRRAENTPELPDSRFIGTAHR